MRFAKFLFSLLALHTLPVQAQSVDETIFLLLKGPKDESGWEAAGLRKWESQVCVRNEDPCPSNYISKGQFEILSNCVVRLSDRIADAGWEILTRSKKPHPGFSHRQIDFSQIKPGGILIQDDSARQTGDYAAINVELFGASRQLTCIWGGSFPSKDCFDSYSYRFSVKKTEISKVKQDMQGAFTRLQAQYCKPAVANVASMAAPAIPPFLCDGFRKSAFSILPKYKGQVSASFEEAVRGFVSKGCTTGPSFPFSNSIDEKAFNEIMNNFMR